MVTVLEALRSIELSLRLMKPKIEDWVDRYGDEEIIFEPIIKFDEDLGDIQEYLNDFEN